MGCFIWWRKHSCLCFGYNLCLCSWCYCNPQAAGSFQQLLQVVWFPFRLMTEAPSPRWQQTCILFSAVTRTCAVVNFQRDGSAIISTYHILIKSNTNSIFKFIHFPPPMWVSVPYVECNTSFTERICTHIMKIFDLVLTRGFLSYTFILLGS
jgi:hypothetical protein